MIRGGMVRVPLLPLSAVRKVFGGSELERDVILELAGDPAFQEALWIASPVLAQQLEKVRNGTEQDERKVLLGLARYLIRASARPTPFGAFAGVGFIPFSPDGSARLELADGHERRARLSFGETMKLVKELEQDRRLRPSVAFFANPAVLRWKTRLRLPYRDFYAHGREGGDLWMRTTGTLAQVLEWAQKPIPYGEIKQRFAALYPSSDENAIVRFLDKLIEEEMLLSTLRPPLTAPDPLKYILGQLPEGIETESTQKVKQLSERIFEYNACPLGGGIGRLRRLYDASNYSYDSIQHHVQVDLRLNIQHASLPQSVQNDLLDAAQLLASLFGTDHQREHLRRYARAFLEAYGQREVPVLEVLDPDVGLGPPSGYHNPPAKVERSDIQPADNRNDSVRLHALMGQLIARSLRSGEIEADVGAMLDDVDPRLRNRAGVELPESTDVFFTLVANESVNGAEPYTIVLSPVGFASPAGVALGRFCYLEPRFEELVSLGNTASSNDEDLALADILYSDSVGYRNDVAIHPSVYPYQIALATTPGVPFERHIPLSDIHVGVDGDRFYLVSRKLRRRVIVRAPHALNIRLAPNVVRFLREVSGDGVPHIPAWHWGPFQHLPFLPRVRYRRVVLSPARWRVPAAVRNARAEERDEAISAWRREWNVPRHVICRHFDNWLVLDLDHEIGRELLIQEKAEFVEEALSLHGLWAQDADGERYCAECVVSLTFDKAPRTSGFRRSTRTMLPLHSVDRRRFPGEQVAYYKLYGPSCFQNDTLLILHHEFRDTEHRWFFVRYRDPDDHLRIRFIGSSERLADATEKMRHIVRTLAEQGFVTRVVLDTYDPEIERYGGIESLAVCERFFCEDSTFVASLLQAKLPYSPQDLALVSVDTVLEALGMRPSERLHMYRLLDDTYSSEKAWKPNVSEDAYERGLSRYFREKQRLAWQLLGVPRKSSGHEESSGDDAWKAQLRRLCTSFRGAVGPTAKQLADIDAAESLLVPFEQLCSSLVHMHANRLGLSRVEEHQAISTLHRTFSSFRHYIPDDVRGRFDEGEFRAV